jgi:PAS domain S-box-containing protein
MSNGSQEKAAPQAVGEPDATAFRTLFDSAPALIWITDDKGQVTYANRRYEAVFGRPSGDMCGEGWKSILHPDDVDAFTTCFFDAFERREPFTADVRVRDRSGATVWLRCEGAPRFDGAGVFLGYTGCNIDVSEARLAEEARFAAEERSRLAAESADLGIWDWNPETGELRWDDRCRALFGLEP